MDGWLAVGLTLLAHLWSAAATLDDFYFSRHPQNLAVREGGSVDLECMVSNTSFIRFYWQLDGETVLNSSRRYQRGSDLHITRVDRHLDGGHFTCIAMNVTTGFSLTSLAASLNIQWMDQTARVQLQAPASPEAIRSGSDVTLRCRADGSGDVTYEWFCNGERVTRAPGRTLRNKRLQLSGVEPRDAGVYSCRATNVAGSALSSVSFPLVVPSPDAPRVTVVPQDQLVRRRTTASFDCQYRDADTTEWFFGTIGPLTSGGKYTVLGNGTLLVTEALEADVGWYHCRGSRLTSGAVPQTYSAQLLLAYLHPLTPASVEPEPPLPELYVVPEGRPFQLTCLPPEGRPVADVWWEAPNGRVLGRSRQQASSHGSAVLALDSARQDQSGNYSCVAENLAGTTSVQVQLLVTAPPELVSGPADLLVEEGQPAELSCMFRGLRRPFSSIFWLKDGKPVNTDAKRSEAGDTLVISRTQMSDAGRYQCVVNSTGFAPFRSPQASLTVKEKLKFRRRPVSRALELGKPGRLHCRATGSSPPTVGWVRLLDSGRPQFEWPSHVHDDNGTLFFDPVHETDGGQYSCVATNAQGLINATVNLTVVVAPKFLTPARSPTEAVVGGAVRLDCQVYGRPEPTVQWERNSQLAALNGPRFVVLGNGSLYIKELQYGDEARYGCIAGNSGGFSRQETQLLVRSSEADLTGHAMTPGVASDDGGMMTRTVMITVSAAAAYLVLVAGLMAWCRYRRIKRKQQYLRTAAEGTSVLLDKTEAGGEPAGCRARYVQYPSGGGGGGGGGAARADSPSGGYHSRSASGHTAGYHSYQSIGSDSDSPPSWLSAAGGERPPLERHQLHPVMPLGHGDFGEVYLARVRPRRQQSEPDASQPVVMVKTLRSRQPAERAEFAREADLYGLLPPHPGVAALLAHCRDQQPHLIVMEYSDWGDLKQFLLATRSDSSRGPPRPPPISVTHATSLCHQVAAGLEHIHSHGFIHRDVATRNCLITSGLTVKLSCSRLSADTYSSEYCPVHGRRLPLRWLPTEAVQREAPQLSSRTDSWAWAVLCWEVLRQGELPHAGLTDQQLLAAGRPPLVVPAEAPAPLAAAMRRCWALAGRDRAEMTEVLRILSEPADGGQ